MVTERDEFPIMGLYGRPFRDCGGYSKGGLALLKLIELGKTVRAA